MIISLASLFIFVMLLSNTHFVESQQTSNGGSLNIFLQQPQKTIPLNDTELDFIFKNTNGNAATVVYTVEIDDGRKVLLQTDPANAQGSAKLVTQFPHIGDYPIIVTVYNLDGTPINNEYALFDVIVYPGSAVPEFGLLSLAVMASAVSAVVAIGVISRRWQS